MQVDAKVKTVNNGELTPVNASVYLASSDDHDVESVIVKINNENKACQVLSVEIELNN